MHYHVLLICDVEVFSLCHFSNIVSNMADGYLAVQWAEATSTIVRNSSTSDPKGQFNYMHSNILAAAQSAKDIKRITDNGDNDVSKRPFLKFHK